jgi:hypothetical protein
MRNYFKDKKFCLIFLDHVDGIPISGIPKMFRSEVTDQSCVVAARASEMSHDSFFGEFVDIRYQKDGKQTKRKFKEVYDHILSLSIQEAENFIAINKDSAEKISYLANFVKDVTVSRLLVLIESDGLGIKGLNKDEWKCCRVEEGGAELVVSFLLSKFCHSVEASYVHKTDPTKNFGPEDAKMNSINDLIYGENWADAFDVTTHYNFSNHSTFQDLIEYEEEWDMHSNFNSKISNAYYYYSVDFKGLKKLETKISIPYRVEKILSEEQKAKLDAEIPQILMDDLDYIAQYVLLQKVDSYKEDKAMSYERAMSAQWASDMYDTLGGDGESNAYLGDGISITPSGKLVDD